MLQSSEANQASESAGDSKQFVTGGINFSPDSEIARICVDGRAIGESMAKGFLQGLDSIEARKNKILAHEFNLLGTFSTADLVAELKRRHGVCVEEINPHEEYQIAHGPVDNMQIIDNTGPAIILIVED